jgi:hypothetical protein
MNSSKSVKLKHIGKIILIGDLFKITLTWYFKMASTTSQQIAKNKQQILEVADTLYFSSRPLFSLKNNYEKHVGA